MNVDSMVSYLLTDVWAVLVVAHHLQLDMAYQLRHSRENVAVPVVQAPDPATIRLNRHSTSPTVVLDFAMEYVNLVRLTFCMFCFCKIVTQCSKNFSVVRLFDSALPMSYSFNALQKMFKQINKNEIYNSIRFNTLSQALITKQ